jgi:hypothetical protein
MIKDQGKLFVLGSVFIAGLLSGIALITFFPTKPEPLPDTSKLRDLLQNTAQTNMGVPLLTDVGLELTIERDALDKEVERIKGLATKFGGLAIVGAGDEKGTEVLAQISPRCAHDFVEAVRHPEKEPPSERKTDREASALLVEIKLTFQG